jgi:hypothetical protein
MGAIAECIEHTGSAQPSPRVVHRTATIMQACLLVFFGAAMPEGSVPCPEEDRYAGTYLGKRELRALVANPRLQVYEDPKAFLTCNHCSPGARNFQDLSGPAADRQDP